MENMIITILLILTALLLWELFFIFPTRWLKVERIYWDTKTRKKILQISDIHIRHLRVSHEKIQSILEEETPDYVFLTGDFIDKHEREFDSLKSLLQMIQKTGIEMYGVLGNHDRYIDEDKVEELEKLLHECGVNLLKNDYVEKNDVFIVGIDDCCKGHCDINKSFDFHNPENKEILVLTHDPDAVLEIDQPFSFFVSGHLHGKQVNVPFFFKIKDMGKVAQQGMYQGKHQHDRGPIYISKGISQTALNIRFWVRSEVTVHHLAPRAENK
ncbi:metallophosphoesterase [Pontibacillus marinus]|uniref:metallophosphoesterase n=1 Tax=Pontibacillus marinus TaxID=273164 RepID=UPI00041C91F5|nr:metallophosphoesterase [Pontibacillus marinus]